MSVARAIKLYTLLLVLALMLGGLTVLIWVALAANVGPQTGCYVPVQSIYTRICTY